MPIVQILVAGVVGTSLITGIMTFINRRGWANADMIRALGSLATRSMQGAVGAGLVIHITSGLLFAFPYVILLSIFVPDGGAAATVVATVIGLLHGIIVGLLIVAVASERHPVPKFRNAGIAVAAAYLAGHLGYGFGVGAVYVLLDIHWPVLA